MVLVKIKWIVFLILILVMKTKINQKRELNMDQKTRFEQIKEFNIDEMAAFLSQYFSCDGCPAKRPNCYDNDAMCIDTIKECLNQKGQL